VIGGPSGSTSQQWAPPPFGTAYDVVDGSTTSPSYPGRPVTLAPGTTSTYIRWYGPAIPGLTFNADGSVSGTPTVVGTWTEAYVNDADPVHLSEGAVTVTVLPPNGETSQAKVCNFENAPTQPPAQVAIGAGAFTKTVSSATLVAGTVPPGFSFDTAGHLDQTGTAGPGGGIQAGTWSLVVQWHFTDGTTETDLETVQLNGC
jgi:hypothetical protein